MFTIGDIKNIAIQIEKNGEETYRKAARDAKNPEIASILTWMAEQEKKHANWFSTLDSDRVLSDEQKELEAVGRTLLQEMVKGNDFLLDPNELKGAQSVKEVIEKSITFEEDTILFYQFLRGCIDDEETILQLEEIIQEEKNHIKQLEEMEKSGLATCQTETSD